MVYDLHADFEWFIKHQDALLKKYNGKTLAIRNGMVLGAFASAADAVNGIDLELGEYLIQRCIPGKEAYSLTIGTPGLVLV
jgi:hypothetical protein